MIKKTIKMIMVVAIFTLLVIPVCATSPKGKVTYIHGVNKQEKTTYAKINSTQIEDSMRITGILNFTYPYIWTWSVDSGIRTNTNEMSFSINVNGTKGNSNFDYYVNGSKRHTTTKPWEFDFR